MKFTFEVVDNQGKIFAKVWPRNEAEPKEWTIEATDPQPNYEGAAGHLCQQHHGAIVFRQHQGLSLNSYHLSVIDACKSQKGHHS